MKKIRTEQNYFPYIKPEYQYL